jgi:hypothetical protein
VLVVWAFEGPNSLANLIATEVVMRDESMGPMSVENVEEFDVWIFASQNLVVSVVPHHSPSSATTEEYELSDE